MRIRALMFCVLAAPTMMAQTAKAPEKKMTQAEANTTTLTRLEDLLAAALVKRDRATFERLLAPKFVYTEDARTLERADFLRETLSVSNVMTEARNDSLDVRIFGNTGIVTGWLIVKGKGKDGPFERRYRFTDVWMPRSGSWQIVAAHDYLVPGK